MRLLLDTQVLLWYLEGNQDLSRPKREMIVRSDNDVYVSIVSLWELAVKISVGKLTLTRSLTDILKQLSDQSIEILAIAPGHVLQVATLRFHHRDPFGRMLIAQSLVEFIPLMTNDPQFSPFGIKVI